MAPGGLTVGSTAELRAALASGGAALVYLLPIVYPLGGSPLNVSGISVTLESLGGEATIDAEAEDFGATNVCQRGFEPRTSRLQAELTRLSLAFWTVGLREEKKRSS